MELYMRVIYTLLADRIHCTCSHHAKRKKNDRHQLKQMTVGALSLQYVRRVHLCQSPCVHLLFGPTQHVPAVVVDTFARYLSVSLFSLSCLCMHVLCERTHIRYICPQNYAYNYAYNWMNEYSNCWMSAGNEAC